MEICLATETSAVGPIGSSPWCRYRNSSEARFFMLDCRASNARCAESSGTPFVGVGVSAPMVGNEHSGYSAHSKKLALVELADR